MLLESPPIALQFFMNVRTLCLECCRFSTDIGLIGSMYKLEILSFYDSIINELPSEIGQLSNLKLLDLRRCTVDLIPSGVLLCLTKLEDLYMGNYFHKEGVEECNQGNCASITELYSLSGLKTLQVSIFEPEVFLKLKDFFFDHLTRFNIFTHNLLRYYADNEFQNKVILENVDLGLFLGDKFDALMRRTEVLRLWNVKGRKNMIKESDEDGFMNLKELFIFGNDDLVEICHGNLPAGSMGVLEKVRLSYLSVMRHLWRGPVQPPCLVNLKVLKMENCEAIRSLFPQSVVRCLVQLQKLEVSNCEILEEIVSKNGAEDDKDAKMFEFPKLNEVELRNLPSFRSFVPVADILGSNNNNDGSILNEVLLPSMETLSLRGIDAVKIVGAQMQPGSLYKLRILNLYRCDKLPCVAAFEAIKLLQNLEKLEVQFCKSMETLFDFEGLEVLDEHGEEVMLGQLDSMKIDCLNELRHIWKNVPKEGFQSFHKLRVLDVRGCFQLRYLLSPSMSKLVVNLEALDLSGCRMMEQVIQMDEEEEEEEESCCDIEKKMDRIVFPRLRLLHLDDLRNLTAFCQGSHDLEVPSLEKVCIRKCPNMNNFCSGSLSAPKLESVEFEEDESFWMGDVNNTIRHIYERKNE